MTAPQIALPDKDNIIPKSRDAYLGHVYGMTAVRFAATKDKKLEERKVGDTWAESWLIAVVHLTRLLPLPPCRTATA